MRLSLIYGIPVRELQQRLTSWEFGELMAFDRIDPIGPERADLAAGIIASTFVNAHGGRTKPIDFMPLQGGRRSKKKTPEQMLAVLTMHAGIHNGSRR